MRRPIRWTAALVTTLVATAAAQQPTFSDDASRRIDEALERVHDGYDFGRARSEIDSVFDEVVAYASVRDGRLLRKAATARRLVTQLGVLDGEQGGRLFEFLRANEQLGATLPMLLAEGENPQRVYSVLDQLRAKYGDRLDEYDELAAAICVVHDVNVRHNINENTAEAEDPLEIFEYFRRNERAMMLGVRSVPAELLVYVVDTSASIEDMYWALKRHGGDRRVGRVYHQVPYDTSYFKRGTDKQLNEHAFTLPNIRRYGGVCADQAYFAMSVGKAIGVPTVYVRGRGGDVSHAWVGYLQVAGDRSGWDFEEGRYDDYEDVRGTVTDPQTGRFMPDVELGLLGDLARTTRDDRHEAVAFADAAERLVGAREWPPAFPAGVRSRREARKAGQVLELVEASLRRCPAYTRSWFFVRDLAEEDVLTTRQKSEWFEVLDRYCGTSRPDFTLAIIRPMIASIDDAREQDRLWNWAFKRFLPRPDLAAEIRFAQGRMWEEQDRPSKAWNCYMDVLHSFMNDGPFAVDAAIQAEQLLREEGRLEHMVPLYEDAWRRVSRPSQMAEQFITQSNWYRLGMRYARALELAGDSRGAERVRRQIAVE